MERPPSTDHTGHMVVYDMIHGATYKRPTRHENERKGTHRGQYFRERELEIRDAARERQRATETETGSMGNETNERTTNQ
jgi:hypothetical protein